MIFILKPCQKEIKDLPLDIKEDLSDALARLEEGHKLSLPLSRPMFSIGSLVYELRFKDRSGIYRIIYLIHCFKKKTEKTAKLNIETAKQRLKGVLK